MKNNNAIVPKVSADLALHKTENLLRITSKILAHRATSLVINETWLDELIAWADENSISEYYFPRNKQELKDLTCLTLFGEELTTLPESIGQLTQLTILDLALNQLTTIPDSIGQLSQLTELNLAGNQLATIPDSIGQLSQLTILILLGNQLTAIPDSIGQLSQLTELGLGPQSAYNHS